MELARRGIGRDLMQRLIRPHVTHMDGAAKERRCMAEALLLLIRGWEEEEPAVRCRTPVPVDMGDEEGVVLLAAITPHVEPVSGALSVILPKTAWSPDTHHLVAHG